jgi:hypothetical protein
MEDFAQKAGSRTGAAPLFFVWGGHSCPLVLTLVLFLILPEQVQTKVKSGGQECPPHMSYFSFVTVTSS